VPGRYSREDQCGPDLRSLRFGILVKVPDLHLHYITLELQICFQSTYSTLGAGCCGW